MMTKISLISAIVVLSLASCNKERTCTCVVDGETIFLNYERKSKSTQEQQCDLSLASYQLTDPEASCFLQ